MAADETPHPTTTTTRDDGAHSIAADPGCVDAGLLARRVAAADVERAHRKQLQAELSSLTDLSDIASSSDARWQHRREHCNWIQRERHANGDAILSPLSAPTRVPAFPMLLHAASAPVMDSTSRSIACPAPHKLTKLVSASFSTLVDGVIGNVQATLHALRCPRQPVELAAAGTADIDAVTAASGADSAASGHPATESGGPTRPWLTVEYPHLVIARTCAYFEVSCETKGPLAVGLARPSHAPFTALQGVGRVEGSCAFCLDGTRAFSSWDDGAVFHWPHIHHDRADVRAVGWMI